MPLDLQELGIKGVAFIFLCVIILIGGILSCFAETFGIVIGILAIIDSILGLFSVYRKDTRGLFVFILLSILIEVLALVNLFVLLLQFRTLEVVPYVGTTILIVVPGFAACLAFDGRGRTMTWSGP